MAAAQTVADGEEEECGLPQDKKVADRGQETPAGSDGFGPFRPE